LLAHINEYLPESVNTTTSCGLTTMDVEMRQVSPSSKGSHVNRGVIHVGSHDEMTLARLGKKQVLKVGRPRSSCPEYH
jgi:hypothetical protein